MDIFHKVLSAVTPDRYEKQDPYVWGLSNAGYPGTAPPPTPVQGPTLRSVAREPGQFVRSLDPRTPSGALNLAMTLVPGAGKGKPTAMQKALLDQLQTGFPISFGDRRVYPFSPAHRTRGYSHTVIPEMLELNKSAKDLAKHLGYSTGNPLRDLLFPSRLENKGEWRGPEIGLLPIEDLLAGHQSRLGFEGGTGTKAAAAKVLLKNASHGIPRDDFLIQLLTNRKLQRN